MRHRKTAGFEALVLDPHFAQILHLLLATLLPPWQRFAASIILLQNVKVPVYPIPAGCI
jgi:hypothetical protein